MSHLHRRHESYLKVSECQLQTTIVFVRIITLESVFDAKIPRIEIWEEWRAHGIICALIAECRLIIIYGIYFSSHFNVIFCRRKKLIFKLLLNKYTDNDNPLSETYSNANAFDFMVHAS